MALTCDTAPYAVGGMSQLTHDLTLHQCLREHLFQPSIGNLGDGALQATVICALVSDACPACTHSGRPRLTSRDQLAEFL